MTNKPKIKLIIGLGNPDKEYETTFHNAGYLAVDFFIKKIAAEEEISPKWEKGSENFNYCKIKNLVFIRPLVFMNQSGRAVIEAQKRFKAKAEEILIAHDDIDITIGQSKLSFNRGSAGHKGVESIMRALKTKNFWRLRIGIGRPVRNASHSDAGGKRKTKEAGQPALLRKALPAGEVVLKKIGKAEMLEIKKVFKKDLTPLELLLK